MCALGKLIEGTRMARFLDGPKDHIVAEFGAVFKVQRLRNEDDWSAIRDMEKGIQGTWISIPQYQ